MAFSILVSQDNGHYVASLAGAPNLRVTAPTRSGALAQMQKLLEVRENCGDFASFDLPSRTAAEDAKTLEEKFLRLRDEWKQKRRPHSSPVQLTTHPAYLKIIALGAMAVPLLLRELQNDPDLWFSALRAITEADPVTNDIRGNVGAMATAWLAWGKERGYEW